MAWHRIPEVPDDASVPGQVRAQSAKQISVPIAALVHAAEQVSKGNLQHRVEVRAIDELAGLVRGFNQMTHELEANGKEDPYPNVYIRQRGAVREQRLAPADPLLDYQQDVYVRQLSSILTPILARDLTRATQ